jgi:ribosome-interacting GTPase 1
MLPYQAMIWDYLGLTRVYTKRKGNQPDLAEPVVLSAIRKGTTVKALCQNVSTHMLRDFNFGKIVFYIYLLFSYPCIRQYLTT